MSSFEFAEPRKRGRSLLIVEGNHEKNELFWLIFRCFPELNIDFEDVWIYGTNIYQLYEEIIKEYGEEWEDIEVDLPFILSGKKGLSPVRIEDFTNIFLVFDYEHHDPGFSERKIEKLQEYFSDSTYVGKLYLNYPMIESYQHIENSDDMEYLNRKVPVTLQPGSRYKALVSRISFLETYVNFPRKLIEILTERFRVDLQVAVSCVERMLEVSCSDDLLQKLEVILNDVIDGNDKRTAMYQLNDLLLKKGYLAGGKSYWSYMRHVLQRVITLNILKGYKIQKDVYDVAEEKSRIYFEKLNDMEILEKQNVLSRDSESGYIWVLNMCILLVAAYRFELLKTNF